MNLNRGFIDFLNDIKKENYDKGFASFHASNLIMQEGIITYDVSLSDKNVILILDFFVKLDSEILNQFSFKEIIDNLIMLFEIEIVDDVQILFVLYKPDIKNLYQRYLDNQLSIESLRSALRKYCSRKEDFDKLIALARASS